mgnify:FL=1
MIAVAEQFAGVGLPVVAVVPSRLPGREGNREIFVHARKGGVAMAAGALADAALEASR